MVKRGRAIEFIDDAEYDENVENYQVFDNVSRDYDDAINDFSLVLIFLKKGLIIVLIMKLKKRLDNFEDSKKS